MAKIGQNFKLFCLFGKYLKLPLIPSHCVGFLWFTWNPLCTWWISKIWPRICNFFSPLTFFGLSTLEKFKITLEQIFLTVGQNNYGNKIPGTSDAWSMGRLSHRPSKPVYYIVDRRNFKDDLKLLDGALATVVSVHKVHNFGAP